MTNHTDHAPLDDLSARFARLHDASRREPVVPLALRRDRLRRLQAVLAQDGARLCAAVQADFGVRSADITRMTELLPLHWQLRQALRRLPGWMRTRSVRTPLVLQPARAQLMPQPLGVVGVMAPWNYPVQLALGPALVALAAGNRVLIKPSEHTPQTAACLAECLAARFEPDELAVVTGDAALARAFSALPWDHLVFTGSPGVAREVAAAAAANLVPTTLELGGKSPCVLDQGVDLARVMPSIVHGKLLNSGQTCIAPDYVLLPRGQEQAFAEAFEATVRRQYPQIQGNPDYTALHSARALSRMQALLDDARAQGGRLRFCGPEAPGDTRQLAPCLVLDAHAGMRVMQEEIFGPILPVLGYDSLAEALALVNAGPRPLALYWFGENPAREAQVLQQTTSGGVAINDTLLQFVHENLPFGGVGASGWGAYHGETGFVRFSHVKPVFRQSRWNAGALLHPPYGARLRRMLDLLQRW